MIPFIFLALLVEVHQTWAPSQRQRVIQVYVPVHPSVFLTSWFTVVTILSSQYSQVTGKELDFTSIDTNLWTDGPHSTKAPSGVAMGALVQGFSYGVALFMGVLFPFACFAVESVWVSWFGVFVPLPLAKRASQRSCVWWDFCLHSIAGYLHVRERKEQVTR